MTTPLLEGPELVASTDVTPIAYWSGGTGAVLLLVHRAMSDHQRCRSTALPQPAGRCMRWTGVAAAAAATPPHGRWSGSPGSSFGSSRMGRLPETG